MSDNTLLSDRNEAAPGASLQGQGTDRRAATRVRASLEELLAGLRALDGEHLEERLELLGICDARLSAVKSETLTALAHRVGEQKAAEAVRDRLRESRGGARRKVRQAERLGQVPETARALAAGAITPQQARMIAEAAEQAPAGKPIDEAELLEAATYQPVDVFGHTVRDHLNERSGDDIEERRRRQRAQRELTISKKSDGLYHLFGKFDPLAGSRIEAALDAVAKKLWHDEDPTNRATVPQRYADALELLATRAGSGKAQGTALVVIADYDSVSAQLRHARLIDGTPLAMSELVQLALEAKILPAIFDRKGQPLWLGRASRDANSAQRLALTVRDRGCVGCRARSSHCQPHHIEFWENGGPTDIQNLCLLCSDCHHRQIHEHGARIVQAANGRYELKLARSHGTRDTPRALGRNKGARRPPTGRPPAGPHGSTNQPQLC